MDAFVIRKSREETPSASTGLLAFNNPRQYVTKEQKTRGLNEIKKVKGQRKLSDLNGVVNLDHLQDSLRKLQDPEVPCPEKIKVLKSLKTKKPATEIIKTSGIGKVVRKLTKEGPDPLKAAALELYIDWKRLIEKRVETKHRSKYIEVDCDEETNLARRSTLSLMKQAAGTHQSLSTSTPVLVQIEKALFRACKNILSKKYRRSSIRIVRALKTFVPQYNLKEIEGFVAENLVK